LRHRSSIFGKLGVICATLLCGCGQNVGNSDSKPAIYAENRCGGVLENWQPQGAEFGELMVTNQLRVSPKGIQWNGEATSESELPGMYEQINQFVVPPGLSFVIAPDTACDTVARMRHTIDKTLHCGDRQTCVEYSDADWAKHEPPPLPAD